MNSLKTIGISIGASIIVVVAALFFVGGFSRTPSNSDNNFAGVTGLAGLNITKDGLKVGTTTPTAKRIAFGTCYIDPYAPTIAASSTASVDCQGTLAADPNGSSALAGVRPGDAVLAQLSTTTAGTVISGIDIIGVNASTTWGHIQLRISNRTGTTYTWPTTSGLASGTATYISEGF